MPVSAAPETIRQLEEALREALKTKFQRFSPQGEQIAEMPVLVDVVLSPELKVIYQLGNRYFIAPFLKELAGGVAVGTGQETSPTWVGLSSLQRRDLERTVLAQCQPWKKPGDGDAKIVHITDHFVVAAFHTDLYRWPFQFRAGRCELGSHAILDIESEQVKTLAKGIHLHANSSGVRMSDAESRNEARRIYDKATPQERAKLPLFMTEVLAEAMRRGGAK